MLSVTSFLWHQTIFQDNPIKFSHVLTLSLDEASCGWVRIIISHKTNVHVQALNECNFVSLGECGLRITLLFKCRYLFYLLMQRKTVVPLYEQSF